MKRFAAAFAAVLALSTVPAAQADEPVQAARVQTVRFDMADQADVAALYGRIRTAAARVCETRSVVPPSRAEREADLACREEAVTRAVARANSPALMQLHQAQHAHAAEIASR